MSVIDRFLKYVKFDTMSNEESESCPSTKGQIELARFLVEELKKIGLKDANVDENGYVMATLESNTDKKGPAVGFIAHMDTSDAMSGKNVNPKIVRLETDEIVLNESLNLTLSTKEFSSLKKYHNEEIIVTDGTTLLGADDKAGIAEIITAMEHLINHPELKHGTIKIAFTPDEEIGRGADLFNVKNFGADFAFTVDGGEIGELEYETFNAASAKIKIKGKSVHPGSAKDVMINAVSIAAEIVNHFPEKEVPEKTSGYEGFYHLVSIEGNVEKASLYYIIRDFDSKNFEARKVSVQKIINEINKKYGNIVEVEIKDQYYNMKDKLKDYMYIIDVAQKSMKEIDINSKIVPVRGGTDGSKLSFMGLPTPNIFTGGHNFHGKYEYIPVKSMHRAVELIVKISQNVINL
ncbi:MAG: pepT [Haloplasmataceae bacterium]|jgi:tripeptide aminopeptidase|nr:pepT [Haloplasmataceae bacterium]